MRKSLGREGSGLRAAIVLISLASLASLAPLASACGGGSKPPLTPDSEGDIPGATDAGPASSAGPK